ncbi:hypothetical protein [Geothrix alkalitolerans]|uniref:hypothetical protein n=1 Tax=Geothrix alkalitolerans TaxID=2922724 RepID=UPI001FAF0573|nr:hypothetical protein [Geothrix alkalitolerans]
MRRAPILLLVPLLLAVGCVRPEVEAFRRQPGPVSVSVSLPSGLADRESFQKEYASALRAHLATRVVVVPEGVKPPVGSAELQVDIRDVSPAPGQPSPTAVGVAVGASVGALSAASGNRGWGVVDGLFWGLWAGSQAAMAQQNTRDRLGYRPQVVRAQVRLVQPGNPEPLWTEAIEPSEVVEAMDPLPPGSRDDDGRIREEEAKGFARVVVQKLSSEFHWMRLAEQRFYQEPAAKTDEPAPSKPEPKQD